MSDTAESSFQRLMLAVALFYFGLFFVFITRGSLKPMMPTLAFICVLVYFWINLWPCAKIAGKSPALWVFLSIALSALGPIVAYLYLKKSARDQNLLPQG